MIPKSFSATALHVAELCMARYEAEQINRGRGEGGTAASLGTSCHSALELFVKATKLSENPEPYTLENLLVYFRMSYMTTFGTADLDTPDYHDGIEMLTNWYNRTIWERYGYPIKVISCEVKDHFDVPTTAGPIPLNYIWDRFDQIGEKEFRVVDYKTSRWDVRPQDLPKKIQARIYALAAAIQLKAQGIEYDTIWVVFDMLRHTDSGIVFTRAEITATWNFILRKAEDILATKEGESEERLNAECRFCVRKANCGALQKNIAVGGTFGIEKAEDAIDLRAILTYQQSAINSAIEELDKLIETDLRERELIEIESDTHRLYFKSSRRRQADPERIESIVGPQIFLQYGGVSITMAQLDKLKKDQRLTPEQRKQVEAMIFYKTGEPKVAIEAKSAIDED
jgi:RecB family exonuclease